MGAWIETKIHIVERSTCQESHPMWVRGLKLDSLRAWVTGYESHPMWVRGLKHSVVESHKIATVAPHVGAWIETTTK